MVNISKKYLSKELRIKAWGLFLKEIKKSESSDACISNIKMFLTPSEMIMLEKRLSIQILGKQGLSYKDIGAMLDVSSTTINFVKHNLTKRPPIHRKYSPNKELKMKPLLPRYKGGSSLF